ncbi:UNKNOWN [Stylonychia lemnae]|uniref:Uncharacterized protein n=1 Tax=Stylonychia lemnae TaxID=5949 RepID=A0A078A6Z9_STYLE|nr:UNKNOWN [Stylonychia lemnae]|eukprot:CDW76551.1 UNKNOWN [Stylonychia lemnae]
MAIISPSMEILFIDIVKGLNSRVFENKSVSDLASEHISKLIVNTSRQAGSDGRHISSSWFPWMSDDMMKYLRIGLTTLLLSFTGQALFKAGLEKFPWYMSYWAAFGAIGVEILLLVSHFRVQSDIYDNMVKAVFEIAYPYTMLTTILYWGVYYEKGWLVWSDFQTWFDSLFIHVLPVILLTVDWLFNNVIFDYQRGSLRILWLTLSYISLNYLAQDITGYDPYPFVTWDDWSTLGWISLVAGTNEVLLMGTAFLTNYMKTGSGVSPTQNLIKVFPVELSFLTKLAGI